MNLISGNSIATVFEYYEKNSHFKSTGMLSFILFLDLFWLVLRVSRSLVWEVDRSGPDRLLPHLPFSAPPVSASWGAVPTPQVWHSAKREHGEEHPLQLPRHAPVHGQIQPEGGGGRHHEPEDRVSSLFTFCSLSLFAFLFAFFIFARFYSHAFFRRVNSFTSFKWLLWKNMHKSVVQTKNWQPRCMLNKKIKPPKKTIQQANAMKHRFI